MNGYLMDWFLSKYALCQGDVLSLTLIGRYINDLANDLKGCTNWIKIEELLIYALFYADDLPVLTADSKANLREMLNTVHEWC